mgnify:CR=1 FL=1
MACTYRRYMEQMEQRHCRMGKIKYIITKFLYNYKKKVIDNEENTTRKLYKTPDREPGQSCHCVGFKIQDKPISPHVFLW